MLELGLKSLLAYLLGSLMGAMLIGRLRGVDIRKLGSGNAGGTNALRTQGPAFALGVVLMDVAKGAIAAGPLAAWEIPGLGADPAIARDWLAAACAFAAAAGHVWPLYHEFQGGKAGATMLGSLAVLAPLLLLPAVVVWLLLVMLAGYVSLATMLAAASVVVAGWLWLQAAPSLLAWGLAMTALIAWAHRPNLTRLRAGTETRARRLWLLRPREEGE